VEAEWGETRTKRGRIRGPRVSDVIEFGARERGLRAKRKINVAIHQFEVGKHAEGNAHVRPSVGQPFSLGVRRG
jgi:hypothetical protein